MLNLLKNLKDKLYIVSIVALSTLLLASVTLNKYQDIKMSKVEKSEETFRLINIGLNQTIADLSLELKKKPNEVIVVTRDIDAELCKGQSAIDNIMKLHPTIIKSNISNRAKEVSNDLPEEPYVDLDGKFSPEFIRMLQ